MSEDQHIYLNEDCRVRSDTLNVVLEKRKVKKENNEVYWVSDGYFPNYKMALKWAVNHDIMELGQSNGLTEIVKRLDKIEKTIESLKI